MTTTIARSPSRSDAYSEVRTASAASSHRRRKFRAPVPFASANASERSAAASHRASARWKSRGLGKLRATARSTIHASAATATKTSVQPAFSWNDASGDSHLNPSVASASRYSANAGRARTPVTAASSLGQAQDDQPFAHEHRRAHGGWARPALPRVDARRIDDQVAHAEPSREREALGGAVQDRPGLARAVQLRLRLDVLGLERRQGPGAQQPGGLEAPAA